MLLALLVLPAFAVSNDPIVNKQYLPKGMTYEHATALAGVSWNGTQARVAKERDARAALFAKADSIVGPARAAVQKVLAKDPRLASFATGLDKARSAKEITLRKQLFADVDQQFAQLLNEGYAMAKIDGDPSRLLN